MLSRAVTTLRGTNLIRKNVHQENSILDKLLSTLHTFFYNPYIPYIWEMSSLDIGIQKSKFKKIDCHKLAGLDIFKVTATDFLKQIFFNQKEVQQKLEAAAYAVRILFDHSKCRSCPSFLLVDIVG